MVHVHKRPGRMLADGAGGGGSVLLGYEAALDMLRFHPSPFGLPRPLTPRALSRDLLRLITDLSLHVDSMWTVR